MRILALAWLALMFRRSARFVRMLCIVSLAMASVLHVANDFRANSLVQVETTVSSAADDLGTDGAPVSEACHSCSIAPYLDAVFPVTVVATTAEVPEGRLVQVSAVSRNITGPPPKG